MSERREIGVATGSPVSNPREVTMLNRVRAANIAAELLHNGWFDEGDALLDAVRCCGEFPECVHAKAVLADETAAEDETRRWPDPFAEPKS